MALHFIVPGDPETLTGGYLYDKMIVAGLRRLGRDVLVHGLSGEYPKPASLADAEGVFRDLVDGAEIVVDGLAFGVMPALAARHGARLGLIALVHHPLALETGLNAEEAARFFESERAALAHARRIIVTSAMTARALDGYGVPATRISVVRPGTAGARLATGIGDGVLNLLSVASLTPRKGHADLFGALAPLRDMPWRLNCVGGDHYHPTHAEKLRSMVRRLNLHDKITFHGEARQTQLEFHYAQADLFVMPSHYEGYGMVLAEATARGLPIVATNAGAVEEEFPHAARVEVGDVAALSSLLRRVMNDASRRADLAAGSRDARCSLPDWASAARAFDQALRA